MADNDADKKFEKINVFKDMLDIAGDVFYVFFDTLAVFVKRLTISEKTFLGIFGSIGFVIHFLEAIESIYYLKHLPEGPEKNILRFSNGCVFLLTLLGMSFGITLILVSFTSLVVVNPLLFVPLLLPLVYLMFTAITFVKICESISLFELRKREKLDSKRSKENLLDFKVIALATIAFLLIITLSLHYSLLLPVFTLPLLPVLAVIIPVAFVVYRLTEAKDYKNWPEEQKKFFHDQIELMSGLIVVASLLFGSGLYLFVGVEYIELICIAGGLIMDVINQGWKYYFQRKEANEKVGLKEIDPAENIKDIGYSVGSALGPVVMAAEKPVAEAKEQTDGCSSQFKYSRENPVDSMKAPNNEKPPITVSDKGAEVVAL